MVWHGAVFKVYSFCTNGDRMEISALVKKLCLEEKGCHKSQSHFEAGKDSFSLNIADWIYIYMEIPHVQDTFCN